MSSDRTSVEIQQLKNEIEDLKQIITALALSTGGFMYVWEKSLHIANDYVLHTRWDPANRRHILEAVPKSWLDDVTVRYSLDSNP